jgi:hypothetical protein
MSQHAAPRTATHNNKTADAVGEPSLITANLGKSS